mgnify:CR=1 FL=1
MDQVFFEKLEEEKGIQFTQQQKEAILHKNGPALVLAVPGAGKTTVLITRTAYLIYESQVDSKKILSLTFSKAAAREMKKRFEKTYGEGLSIQPHFSTIHSFAHQVLRKELNTKGIEYYLIEGKNSPIHKMELLRQIYQDYNHKAIKDEILEDLANAISFVKNRLLKEKEIQKQFSDIKNFPKIYEGYETWKRKNRYIDFDDMLTLAYGILKKNKQLLNFYRKRYSYIQVDEGQDTSLIQFALVRLITQPNHHLFIVADDDQSIYGFRGADPKELTEFKKAYPKGKVFFMEENFRSTQSIVEIAGQFIRGNQDRYEKNIHTQKERGKPIIILKVNNYIQQLDYLLEELKSKKEQGTIAILFRNHLSTVPLIDAFFREEIPFYLREGKRYFFHHWVTRDILSFIRLALNPKDIKSFENIYYKMNQYISRKTVDLVQRRYHNQSVFEILTDIPQLPSYQRKRMYELEEKFYTLESLSPLKALEYIENQLCYEDFLREREKSRPAMVSTGEFILERLKSIGQNLSTLKEFLHRLEGLEKWLENCSHQQKSSDTNIVLSTLHGAKGLEFDRVYMIDLMQDQIPTYSSLKQFEQGDMDFLEEERRLFYVGMTRAKKELTLMTISSSKSIRQEPSQFIKEVQNCLRNENLTEKSREYFKPRDRVRHRKFGQGKVRWVKENTIAIDFKKYGVKKLEKDYCIHNGILEKV